MIMCLLTAKVAEEAPRSPRIAIVLYICLRLSAHLAFLSYDFFHGFLEQQELEMPISAKIFAPLRLDFFTDGFQRSVGNRACRPS